MSNSTPRTGYPAKAYAKGWERVFGYAPATDPAWQEARTREVERVLDHMLDQRVPFKPKPGGTP